MKNNRGITLIAMIVTIIVLLILSYISIFILMGDNGILSKAMEAKKSNDEAEQKENNNFNAMEKQSDKYFADSQTKTPVLLTGKAKLGDYISYDNTSEWKVIDCSASGVKIISNTTSITQRIGNSGESTSLSYSNAISGLNTVASNAKNSYAATARSVEYNDISNLTSLNMLITGKAYWFANTYTYGNQFHVGVIDESGAIHQNSYNDSYSLVGWSSTQYATINRIFDVRIIVTLLGTVNTNDGDGSKENPYKLCQI